ncbi:hypothetical protein Tco_0167326 [Tanacetum coccineum]
MNSFAEIKARESKPKLYDGNTILKMDTIVVPDSDETIELSEKSRSKMLLKEQDPLFEKHKEQGLVHAALKNKLRKLKGKAIDNKDTVTHSADPNVSKDNMEPITPKLLNKRTAHSPYIKHSQEDGFNLKKQDDSDCVLYSRERACLLIICVVSNSFEFVKSRAKSKENENLRKYCPNRPMVFGFRFARSTMTEIAAQPPIISNSWCTVNLGNDQVAKIMVLETIRLGMLACQGLIH